MFSRPHSSNTQFTTLRRRPAVGLAHLQRRIGSFAAAEGAATTSRRWLA